MPWNRRRSEANDDPTTARLAEILERFPRLEEPDQLAVLHFVRNGDKAVTKPKPIDDARRRGPIKKW